MDTAKAIGRKISITAMFDALAVAEAINKLAERAGSTFDAERVRDMACAALAASLIGAYMFEPRTAGEMPPRRRGPSALALDTVRVKLRRVRADGGDARF